MLLIFVNNDHWNRSWGGRPQGSDVNKATSHKAKAKAKAKDFQHSPRRAKAKATEATLVPY